MAQRYRSSRSGGSRGGSRGPARPSGGGRNGRRGRAAPPPRRGGGSAAPTIAAIVLVVGVIALIVILSSRGGSPEDDVTRTSHTKKASGVPAAKADSGDGEPPWPMLTAGLKKMAEGIAKDARELAKDGNRLYDEAGRAKGEGDQTLWQAKLEEASGYFHAINDSWNELIMQIDEELPADCEYDAEQVANKFFPVESEAVRRAGKRLAAINKDRR